MAPADGTQHCATSHPETLIKPPRLSWISNPTKAASTVDPRLQLSAQIGRRIRGFGNLVSFESKGDPMAESTSWEFEAAGDRVRVLQNPRAQVWSV